MRKPSAKPGKPRKPESERRTRAYTVRFSADEEEEMLSACGPGIDPTTYIRNAALVLAKSAKAVA